MGFNCGFTSNSLYVKDSDQRQAQVKNSPKLVIELECFDEDRNIYWYPSVINMGKRGIIYPEGIEDEYSWKYAKVVDIPKEDQDKYPVPGKDGEFYETRLGVDSASEYGKYEFLNACKDMGIVKDELL